MTDAPETQDNPYGVSVPQSRSRLPWMRAAPLKDDHPLVPWAEKHHARQWVDVDNAQEQLKKFARCLDRLDELILPEADLGQLVVVTGPVGMGKTTLIHQCVHLTHELLEPLQDRVPQDSGEQDFIRPPRPFVVMTGGYNNHESRISYDDQGQFAATQDINTAIRKAIAQRLNGHFPDAADDTALTGTELDQSFQRISTLLAEQDLLLLVIVPHMRWMDDMGSIRTEFLRTCLRHARSRIVLFVEVRHQNPARADEVVEGLWPDKALTHLKLGRLNPEDTVKFSLSARPAGPPSAQTTGPPRDPEVWRLSDVRELRKKYFEIAERQSRQGVPVRVTADDLPEPSLDLTAMARRPSAAASTARTPEPRQST